MNRTGSVLKLHLRDKFMWLYLPWIILSSSFIVNIVIGLMVDEPIYSGGLSSIFIFMLVAGTVVLSQTFPFAIGFSIRRTDFYTGTLVMAGLIGALTSILLLILGAIESVTNSWGGNLRFFTLPYLNDGTLIEQFIIFFILLVHMFMLGFAIASIHRRYGRTGMFAFFIISFLVLSIASFLLTYNSWWLDMFEWFGRHTAFELALWMALPIVVYMLVSYGLLRKSSV